MTWNAAAVASLPGVPLGYEWEDDAGCVFKIVRCTTTAAVGVPVQHDDVDSTKGYVTATYAAAADYSPAGVVTGTFGTANYYGVIQKKFYRNGTRLRGFGLKTFP